MFSTVFKVLSDGWLTYKLTARSALNEAELKDICAFNYFVTQGTTREAYETLWSTFPELEDISSIYLAQKTVVKLSGLNPKYADCCINSCCCYMGKYKMLDHCPYPDCNKPWYDESHRPRKQFQFLPIIPRLIALFLNKATAESINYRHKYCETRDTEKVTNVFDGTLTGGEGTWKLLNLDILGPRFHSGSCTFIR